MPDPDQIVAIVTAVAGLVVAIAKLIAVARGGSLDRAIDQGETPAAVHS